MAVQGRPDDLWPPGYELGETVLAYGATITRRANRGGQSVLIKTARAGTRNYEQTSSALEREHRILIAIDHPALPPVIEVVRNRGQIALVFPDHRGHRLGALLDRIGHLPVDAALAMAIELASALAALHRAGHAHGLLRPELVELSERGHVYLHAAGQLPRGTERGHDELLEVPRHMSPEMILGDEADAASDVFLFGLLLFQAIAGEHPFSGDEAGISQRIRHSPTPSLRRQVPEAPEAVERVVRRCLEKRPRDRYADLSSVQALLVRALRDRTSLPRETLVSRALAAAGLSDEIAPPRERHLDRSALASGPRARWMMIAGGGVIAAAVVLFAWQSLDGSGGPATNDPQGIVGHPARLRLLAHPWAEVHIDGKLIDVTPVGRPLELAPGRHEVVFKHPHAPDVKRVIEIVPGQTVVLDVAMQVVRPLDAGAGEGEGDASAEELSP